MIIFIKDEHIPSPEMAGPLAEMLFELSKLSRLYGWNFLAHLIEMARFEALTIEARGD
ncbi:hypothetical protein [Afifella aestuarii]|uniref:hypothetical protein n=1 Tax=Afifella aestuarii TaxID=1909496 RepID=UPI0013E3786F|nr:hypothetical protein [Afifella aestuarii]